MVGYALQDKADRNPDHCIELWKNLSLKLIIRGFKDYIMFSFPLLTWLIDISLGEMNTRNRELNLKLYCTLYLRGWRFHAKPAFFINIFGDELHFDAMIIGLCRICHVMGQTLGESML